MQGWSNKIKQSRERRPDLPGKMRIGSFEIMQEIFDFLSGEENEGIPTPDEGLQEWKKQKSEARARMVAMQRQPYDVKKKRSELRAKEFVSEMDKRDLNAHVSVGGVLLTNAIIYEYGSIEECADDIKIPTATLTRYASGLRIPKYLKRICETFNLSADDALKTIDLEVKMHENVQ